MKKLLTPFIVILVLLSSCSEIPPDINPIVNQGECPVVNESSVSDQSRQVLIEEFTGVKCVNCPAGSEAIKNLIDIHDPQLIAVSIHAGFFSTPYNDSSFDFRTDEGDAVLSFVGEPLGFPTAVINRKLFQGEMDLQISQNQWADFINQEINISPKIKLAIKTQYEESSRELQAEVSIFVQENINDEDVRLSIMITESHIIDYQLTPGGKESEYEHNHVLRGMMTNFDGNPLSEELTTGSSYCKKHTMIVPIEWNVNNCEIISFVHTGGSSKEIFQAHQESLIN
jgi:hypothetical protein